VARDAGFVQGGEFLVYSTGTGVRVFALGESASQVASFDAFGSVVPLGPTSFLGYDGSSSCVVVDFKTKGTQSEPIPASSFVRPLRNGVVAFAPVSAGAEFVHFDTLRLRAVSPAELYERNCQAGLFGDAIALMRQFDLPSDTYYKALLTRNSGDQRIIGENLARVNDKAWAAEFIVNLPGTIDAITRLLSLGAKKLPDSERIKRAQERLMIFASFDRDRFVFHEWQEFRDCALAAVLGRWAKTGDRRFQLAMKQSRELTVEERITVLREVSLFADPQTYLAFAPQSAEWYRLRAEEVDARTGRVSYAVAILEAGAAAFPELQEQVTAAHEFRSFILRKGNLKLSEWRALDQVGRTLAYTGVVLPHELPGLVLRNPWAEERSVASPMLKELLSAKPLYCKATPVERASAAGALLRGVRDDLSGLLKECDIVLDSAVSGAFVSAAGDRLDSRTQAELSVLAAGGEPRGTFVEVRKAMTQELVLKVARALTSKGDWVSFHSAARCLGSEFDAAFREELAELDVIACVYRGELANVSITTREQALAALRTSTEIRRSAPSCDPESRELRLVAAALNAIPVKLCEAGPEQAALGDLGRLFEAGVRVPPRVLEERGLVDAVLGFFREGIGSIDMRRVISAVRRFAPEAASEVEAHVAELCLRLGKPDLGEPFLAAASLETRSAYLEKKFDRGSCNRRIREGPVSEATRMIGLTLAHAWSPAVVKARSVPVLKLALQLNEPATVGRAWLARDAVGSLKFWGRCRELELLSEEAMAWLPALLGGLSEAERAPLVAAAIDAGFVVPIDIVLSYRNRRFLEAVNAAGSSPTVAGVLAAIEGKTSLVDARLLELVEAWARSGLVPAADQVVLLRAMTRRFVRDSRAVLAQFLSEETELAFLDEKRVDFGLGSAHEAVRERARALLETADELTESAILGLLARGQAALYLETRHWPAVLECVKTREQLRQLGDSLTAADRPAVFLAFACQFLGIPRQLRKGIEIGHIRHLLS
jgi:hypothetical protein